MTDLNNFHLQWLRFTRWTLAYLAYLSSISRKIFLSLLYRY